MYDVDDTGGQRDFSERERKKLITIWSRYLDGEN